MALENELKRANRHSQQILMLRGFRTCKKRLARIEAVLFGKDVNEHVAVQHPIRSNEAIRNQCIEC